jgi:hypothetical protein
MESKQGAAKVHHPHDEQVVAAGLVAVKKQVRHNVTMIAAYVLDQML